MAQVFTIQQDGSMIQTAPMNKWEAEELFHDLSNHSTVNIHVLKFL